MIIVMISLTALLAHLPFYFGSSPHIESQSQVPFSTNCPHSIFCCVHSIIPFICTRQAKKQRWYFYDLLVILLFKLIIITSIHIHNALCIFFTSTLSSSQITFMNTVKLGHEKHHRNQQHVLLQQIALINHDFFFKFSKNQLF